ncbi:MAG: NAD(P)H-dependent oxidoreductase [Gemmataceae bacterium]|nr:NAD(P)H-dependent oxidoreductase [Gemmataceae bacterium]
MAVVPASNVLDQLRWRYAVKKFDSSKKIPAETWAALEHAIVLSPSSYGLQLWKFVVITDPALREKLKAVSWGQTQITDASHLVVFCGRTGVTEADLDRHIGRMAQVRGVSADSLADYKKMMMGTTRAGFPAVEWTARQAYIALGVFLTSAALLGVDACPMEGFENEKYDVILGLKEQGYASAVVATAGYRATDDKYAEAAKVRFDVNDVIDRR